MAETLNIPAGLTKSQRYESLLPQVAALIEDENDLVANLANIAAALKYGMGYFWVGFYSVKGNELVLGPFQGPVACTRIAPGKGVCGTSWKEKRALVVKNVDEFPGHIACSSDSRSEIVLPVLKNGEVVLILDIDSDRLADFDDTDLHYLRQLTALIEQKNMNT